MEPLSKQSLKYLSLNGMLIKSPSIIFILELFIFALATLTALLDPSIPNTF